MKDLRCLSPFLLIELLRTLDLNWLSTTSTTKGARDNIPATYSLFTKGVDGPARKAKWKYRGLIGVLDYLQGTTRPDISMATHQCASFSTSPKLCHERAVKKIVRYLLDTKDRGIIFRSDFSRGLECFVDADFAGDWKDGDHSSLESVLSRTGFVIKV